MNKRQTKLYFDQDIWEWLQAESKRLRCSVSEVVRRLALAEMTRQRESRVAAVAERVGEMGVSATIKALAVDLRDERDGVNPDCPDCCQVMARRDGRVFGGWQCNHCKKYWTPNLRSRKSIS